MTRPGRPHPAAPLLAVIAAGILAGILFGLVAAISAVLLASIGLAVLQTALDAATRHHRPR